MTLIVFVVLMIFGTFALGFMVTENKQSLHHQHKTEAYYVARAGAVAVEAAIMEAYDIDNGKSLDENITETEKMILVDGINAKVTVKKEKVEEKIEDEEKTQDIQKYIYTITSEGESNNIKDIVEKVILVNVIETTESVVKITSPLTYIEKISDILKKEPFNAQKGDNENYKLYSFEFENFSEITGFTKLTDIGSTISAGDYKVDASLISTEKKTVDITIDGEVNIYVKEYVNLNNVNIKYNDDSSKLNIYIYGEASLEEGITLKLGDSKDKSTIYGNFFIKQGNVSFDFHEVNFVGNIVSNGDYINLVSHDNSKNPKVRIKGIIYGPNATVNFGKVKEDWSSMSIAGAVVGKELWYHSKNGNDNHIDKFIVSGNLDGIDSPFEDKVTITVTKNPGYFK